MTKNGFMDFVRSEVKRTGKYPKVEVLSKRFRIPMYRISQMQKALSATGDLVRWNNWYRLPEQMMESVPEESIEDQPAIQEEDDGHLGQNPSVGFLTKDISMAIFSWVLFVIGLGAAVMSAYFTKIYLVESLSEFMAWFFSLLMVVFSVVVFGLIALMVSGRLIKSRWRFMLVAVFSLLWMLTAGYSILATVAGQYNRRAFNQQASIIEENRIVVDKNLIQLEVDARNDLLSRRDDLRRRLASLLSAADISMLDPDAMKESWTSIQSRIVATQDAIAAVDKSIEGTRSRERDLLSADTTSTVARQDNFFKWMAGLFSAQEGQIQFGMAVFPAVFLDIIAPVLLTLFVFMRRKNKAGDL